MGWGKGSPHHCAIVRSYAQAQKHFTSRGPVKSKRWLKNERPLVGSPEVWFKSVEGPDVEHYSLFCGRGQEVLRFWKPEQDGTYRVWIYNNGSNWVQRFLRHQGWGYGLHPTVGSREGVLVPLSWEADTEYNGIPKDWSACVTLDRTGKLILEKSEHRPVYVRKSSQQDKADRKRVLGLLDSTLDLIMLRLPTFHAESVISRTRGRSFGGTQDRDTAQQVGETLKMIRAERTPLTDEILTGLLPHCQEVYNVALSKAAWRDNTNRSMFHWNDISGNVLSPIKEEVYRATLRRSLLRWGGLMVPHGNIELPKFPTELPKRYFFRKIGK